MVKRSKILEKVISGSKNVSFGEFISLLEGFGYVMERIHGSHHIFKHPDVPQLLSVQPRKDSKAKPYQLHQFLKQVEEYQLSLEEE
ncbi:MAG: type II toxin-antitoxin system HicA family toxin [Chloroflexota bacterium]|nr:type II toxin-antitoxin system HicA family toxin [Anaerolineae bacterium]